MCCKKCIKIMLMSSPAQRSPHARRIIQLLPMNFTPSTPKRKSMTHPAAFSVLDCSIGAICPSWSKASQGLGLEHLQGPWKEGRYEYSTEMTRSRNSCKRRWEKKMVTFINIHWPIFEQNVPGFVNINFLLPRMRQRRQVCWENKALVITLIFFCSFSFVPFLSLFVICSFPKHLLNFLYHHNSYCLSSLEATKAYDCSTCRWYWKCHCQCENVLLSR